MNILANKNARFFISASRLTLTRKPLKKRMSILLNVYPKCLRLRDEYELETDISGCVIKANRGSHYLKSQEPRARMIVMQKPLSMNTRYSFPNQFSFKLQFDHAIIIYPSLFKQIYDVIDKFLISGKFQSGHVM